MRRSLDEHVPAAERDEILALVRWFRRRYPSGAEIGLCTAGLCAVETPYSIERLVPISNATPGAERLNEVHQVTRGVMTQARESLCVGSKLQEARQRQGLSLDGISNRTKISVRYLKAIERNDVSPLPGGVFARGFVRSFATEVGLDSDALVQEFVAEHPDSSITTGFPDAEATTAPEPPAISSDPPTAGRPFIAPSTIASMVAVAALLVASAGYLATSKRAARPVASRGAEQTAAAPHHRAHTSATSDQHESDQQRRAADATPLWSQAQQPAASDLGASTPTIPAVSAQSPASDATPSTPPLTPAADPPDGPPPPTPPAGSADSPDADHPSSFTGIADRLAVVLSVTRACWVIATVDGKKVLSRLLDVGDEETLEARRDLVLTAGDAGAVIMTINGMMAKALGPNGETVTARLDHSTVKGYLKRK
jgi:cytoskeleton protein RodZ